MAKLNIEQLILSGPGEVENQLSRLSNGFTLGNLFRSKKESPADTSTYIKYIDIISDAKTTNGSSSGSYFLTGYFYQRAAVLSPNKTEALNLYEKSLLNYQLFLQGTTLDKSDLNFYAQWQKGNIQQVLGIPWSEAEGSYLKCLELNPARGENLREIIIHYTDIKEWDIAYIYSFFCVTEFLDKPIPAGKWAINDSFYTWEMLKFHIDILIHLNNPISAKKYLGHLSAVFAGEAIQSNPGLKGRIKELIDTYQIALSNLESAVLQH